MGWIARYQAAEGRTLLGGVRSAASSVFSHKADAEAFLATSLELNAGATGFVFESFKTPEIVRHCPDVPDAIAQAVGGVCPHCKAFVMFPMMREEWRAEIAYCARAVRSRGDQTPEIGDRSYPSQRTAHENIPSYLQTQAIQMRKDGFPALADAILAASKAYAAGDYNVAYAALLDVDGRF